jgi:hypothetical protein
LGLTYIIGASSTTTTTPQRTVPQLRMRSTRRTARAEPAPGVGGSLVLTRLIEIITSPGCIDKNDEANVSTYGTTQDFDLDFVTF